MSLVDVEKATGIPKSTLHRLEQDHPDITAVEACVSYQDVIALAKFYDVSADYLFGLTENLKHHDTPINKLQLSDEAVSELISGNLNTRLLSEIITHPDFAGLLAALEVYIDRSVADKIELTNKITDMAIGSLEKKTTATQDEIMAALTESKVGPDDYIRYRLTRRFEKIAQSLYEAHAPETQDETDNLLLKMFGSQLSKYEKTKEKTKEKTGSAEEAKLELLTDQMGVDLKKSTEEEKRSLLSLLGRSKFASFLRKRK